jgi:hypothetical protein
MRIDRISRKGKTITLKGSFQPGDLRHVLDMANKGAFAVPKPKPPTTAERYAAQIAAVRKVCADLPDAAATILDDLRNERRGWYHATLLCYCEDVEPWQWANIATHYEETRPCANGAPAQPE